LKERRGKKGDQVNELAKNWRIWLLFVAIFLSFFVVSANLINTGNPFNFGIDFMGGTLFQIHLAEKAPNMEEVENIIQNRLNWSGMSDIRVYGAEEEFVFVIVPETRPGDVERIENLIKRQGRFEVLIDANIMFTGKDLIQVDQSSTTPAFSEGPEGSGTYQWHLPFVLSGSSAERFRDLAFHRCPLISFEQSQYDCALTYFFIDRPRDAVFIFTPELFELDKVSFKAGNFEEGIPAGTDIMEILLNLDAPYLVLDKTITEEQNESILQMAGEMETALIPDSLPVESKNALKKAGFELREFSSEKDAPIETRTPWLWKVSGIQSIVRLQPSITGDNPYVNTMGESPVFTDLQVTGQAPDYEAALGERNGTKIILQSGSLPVSVESISSFYTSPTQGLDFLFKAAITGFIVLCVVSIIIFFRYRMPKLSLAIIFTALVEAFITTTLTSSLGGTIDLAAIAGIIAAVGTGVDDQIVITDELLRGGGGHERTSLLRRVRNAFFIVIAAAATTLATMLPIILFGSIMVRLIGFAVAITIGVIVGVFVTRPAYGEIAKYLMRSY